jgi:erythrin-vacuolar iron transport family protein
MKRFADLTEQEVLALAISNEDEDNRIYRSFADGLRGSYPDTAAMYDRMAEEEIEHHDMLLELYRRKFGEFLPLIRRQDVKGFVARRPIWLNRPLGLEAVRKFAEEMEFETARFYRRAAEAAHDNAVRDLLTRLAAAEDKHEKLAQELGEKLDPKARHESGKAGLHVVQHEHAPRRSRPRWRIATPSGRANTSAPTTTSGRSALRMASAKLWRTISASVSGPAPR